MADTIKSAIACGRLMLQLMGIHPATEILANSHPNIDSGLKLLNQNQGARLRRRRLPFHKVATKHLPIAFLGKDGDYRLLAKMDSVRGLVQHPFQPNTELWTEDQLRNAWTGEVIRLYAPSLKFSLTWFLPAFWKYRWLLLEVLLFSFILQLLALMLPLFFQVVMDKVLFHQGMKTLDILILALVATGIYESVLRALREYQYSHTANRIDVLLGVNLVQHLLGLPLLYFKNRQVGALVARVRELDSVREFLGGSLFTLVVDLIFMSVFLVVMWSLSPMLTAIVLVSVPIYILIAWKITQPLQDRLEEQFRYNAVNTAFLTESIAGAETVKSLAVEPRLARRWEIQTRDLVAASYRTQLLSSFSNHGVQFLGKFVSSAILWLGAQYVIEQRITLGQLIAFKMMSDHLSQPLSRLVELWSQFVQAQVAVDKLGDILNMPREQESKEPPIELQGNINLQAITFRYQPGAPLVLHGITLQIKAGEHIGIVGESGSGKSTLARLLLRLYLPENGCIWFDDHPLDSINIVSLRRQVSVVLQENFLFNRSVRDNIAQAIPEASLERVMEAAQLAGAHEFILRLPMGYDTVLAEGGSSLSGGQRQRVAIARALLPNPKILIFDEATSALDDESQAIIQENMERISVGRTVVTIAHRLSTVRQCHRIIVLHQGQIIEQGEHESLLGLQGKYARLWNLQQDLKQEAS
ncbi:MAG: type I secretion system permease/ATPase [Candidatus Symbiodolus clandestinus]